MNTHTIRCATLLGFALGAPVIALATSALAAADPDYVVYEPISSNGPDAGQPGEYFFTGGVKDLSHPTVGIHGDGVVGNWIATNQIFAGLDFYSNTAGYELYVNGADSHDYIEEYSNFVASDATGTELWGNTFTEELNSSGVVIGMSDVIDFGGQDFTLFDTLPSTEF